MNFTSIKIIKKIKTQVEFCLTLCILDIGSSSRASEVSVSKTSPRGPGSLYKKAWPAGLLLHLFNPPQSQKQQPALPQLGVVGQKQGPVGKRTQCSRKNWEFEVKRTLLQSWCCHGLAVRSCISPGKSALLTICTRPCLPCGLIVSMEGDTLHHHYWTLFKNQCINQKVLIKFLAVC